MIKLLDLLNEGLAHQGKYMDSDEIIDYLKSKQNVKYHSDNDREGGNLNKFDTSAKKNFITWSGDNEEYKKEGNTHGFLSHAIKHGIEFNSSLFKKLRNDVKDFIKANKGSAILKNATSSGGKKKPQIVSKGMEIDIDDINDHVIQNTLDHINDKIVYPSSGKLTNQDKELLSLMLPVLANYEKEYDRVNKGKLLPSKLNLNSPEGKEKAKDRFINNKTNQFVEFIKSGKATSSNMPTSAFDGIWEKATNKEKTLLKNPNTSEEVLRYIAKKYITQSWEEKGNTAITTALKNRNIVRVANLDSKPSDKVGYLNTPNQIISALKQGKRVAYKSVGSPKDGYLPQTYIIDPTVPSIGSLDSDKKVNTLFKPDKPTKRMSKPLIRYFVNNTFPPPKLKKFFEELRAMEDEKFEKLLSPVNIKESHIKLVDLIK